MSVRILPPSLAYLIRLELRAKRRRLLQNLKTPKGFILSCVSLALIAMWIGPSLVMGLMRKFPHSELGPTIFPFGMLMFCLMQLVSLKPERGIVFSPAEVDFLFSGPFLRRDLLLYKIVGYVIVAFGIGLFVSAFALQFVSNWLAGYAAIVLALLFTQLLTMAATLVASIVEARTFGIVRRLVVFGAIAILGAAVYFKVRSFQGNNLVDVAHALRASPVGRVLLAPFEVFGHVAFARSIFPELIGWSLLALAMNVALVLVIVRLDANFLEASIETSRKFYERVDRIRRGSSPLASMSAIRLKWRLPMFPWLQGAGPIAWRQAVTATRASGGIMMAVIIFAVSSILPLVVMKNTSAVAAGPFVSMLVMMSVFFLPQMICFDFRGDADRIETVKALPISPTAIVIGQIGVPVVVASLVQSIFIVTLAVVQPTMVVYALIALAFLVPLNVLVFGLENLIFLLFPYRMKTAVGDMSAMGRRMLLLFFRMLGLFVAGGIAAGVGAMTYLVTGSLIAAVSSAWPVAMCLAIALVPLLVMAFNRFDPSLDTLE